FRDYLYIPLGGSNVDTVTKIRNVFIIFLISGLWHGAKWTFIVWGLLNAMLIIPSFIFNSNRQNLDIASKGKILPSIKDIFSILSTFILITFTWIFFRSSSLQQALDIIKEIFSKSLFSIPTIFSPKIGLIISIFMLIEWIGREREFAIEYLGSKLPKAIRWAIYYAISHAVIIYAGSGQQFIYFQF
ncbi:MAG: MBOAT family protein, partial [Pseudarcicella sp.]|nr:MBOAT family protein [Pseudarcicella sp.]